MVTDCSQNVTEIFSKQRGLVSAVVTTVGGLRNGGYSSYGYVELAWCPAWP
jgi:hypothetical protein